jgi:hypothetical protein
MDFGASNDDGKAPGASADTAAQGAPPVASAAEPPQAAAPRPRAPASRRPEPQIAPPPAAEPAGWPIYLAAFAVAVLWALGPIAFALGYRSAVAPLRDERFALIVFSLLAVGPAALVFGVAFFIRQSQKLAAASRRARELETTLLSPALRAALQAGEVTRAVREEIAQAAAAADVARESLTALREVLSAQTDGLVQATQASLNAAQQLSGELGRERGELQALTQALDSQAVRAAEILDQQAQRVAGVSQAAEVQLREAETVLAARAAGLAAAADEASALARTAGEDLARHIARLETAGTGVADQVRAVEGGLSEQRQALLGLAQALRGDHETFAAEADAHAARLDDFIGEVRRAAGEMSARAVDAGEGLRVLIGEAAERFAELSTTVRVEREAFGETAARSLDEIARAAGDQRAQLEAENRRAIEALGRAAEETRQAAARHAAAAREQVDQLSEAAFAAGQKANQVFEARLEEARALIDQSAKMVGDAGAAAARKLDEGAASARAALDELATLMAAVEARARDLPADAQAQAETVRVALAQGMDALLAQARRTADEAHAIDVAFQERVRRNFEMLGEAVRLMGAVAATPTAAAPAPATPAAAPSPAASAPPSPKAPVEAPAAPFAQAYAPPNLRPAAPAARSAKSAVEPPAPAAEAAPPASEAEEPPGGALAERLGLRPRLKLTPTASDEAFSAIFDEAGPPKGAPSSPGAAEDEDEEESGETWTWKDLLASLGGDEIAESEESQLAAELGKMGVEPEKLLPEARIDQIAAALQTGDVDGARQVVKRLAGASSRRIVRRLFTDEELKAKASDFVRRYQALVDDAAVRDPEGRAMARLLVSQPGRVYLLLDQALGDAV